MLLEKWDEPEVGKPCIGSESVPRAINALYLLLLP